MIVVILPALIRAVSEQWPPDAYWQAALATGVIAAIIKGIEVYLTRPQLPPGVSASDYRGPGMMQRWLVG
jgi:hypothetical protein